MSAMQDFYTAPIWIDEFVARARAERSEALAGLLLKVPAKLNRFAAYLRSSALGSITGKVA